MFDHSKLNHANVCQNIQCIEENKDIPVETFSNTRENLTFNNKDIEDKRPDSGMEKSLNDSLTTTSGFLEIENSQKENSKQDKLDASSNSMNNGDDEDEDIPSLAIDSEDDMEWDKCSSTKERPNSGIAIKRSSESIEMDDENEYEIIKDVEDETRCISSSEDINLLMKEVTMMKTSWADENITQENLAEGRK